MKMTKYTNYKTRLTRNLKKHATINSIQEILNNVLANEIQQYVKIIINHDQVALSQECKVWSVFEN